ncbi:MAG: 50S ribosomal protein L11 methyltransferase [Oscillospiraceae bacterium]|nr:50S ribosomal protein L11 methyltransferase [Oscillospiraceae bacterium]
MTWLEIEIFTTPAGVEPLSAALEEIGISGFVIKNPEDFEEFLAGKQGKWDLVDENLMHLREGQSSLKFYLPQGDDVQERLAQVDETVSRLRAQDKDGLYGPLDECVITNVEEESWQDSWKQYWKPTRVGKSLVVCPSWEEYAIAPGETVLRLDPGMAFGTGTHESTRLCMELAEQVVSGGERVLDLGCGSGILAITALLLGADSALGVDIDGVAVKTCTDNADLNGVEARADFRKGNLAAGVSGQFDLIFANIIADVILELVPDIPRLLAPGGVFITSGILCERAEEIGARLEGMGLNQLAKLEQGGWAALMYRK